MKKTEVKTENNKKHFEITRYVENIKNNIIYSNDGF